MNSLNFIVARAHSSHEIKPWIFEPLTTMGIGAPVPETFQAILDVDGT